MSSLRRRTRTVARSVCVLDASVYPLCFLLFYEPNISNSFLYFYLPFICIYCPLGHIFRRPSAVVCKYYVIIFSLFCCRRHTLVLTCHAFLRCAVTSLSFYDDHRDTPPCARPLSWPVLLWKAHTIPHILWICQLLTFCSFSYGLLLALLFTLLCFMFAAVLLCSLEQIQKSKSESHKKIKFVIEGIP